MTEVTLHEQDLLFRCVTSLIVRRPATPVAIADVYQISLS